MGCTYAMTGLTWYACFAGKLDPLCTSTGFLGGPCVGPWDASGVYPYSLEERGNFPHRYQMQVQAVMSCMLLMLAKARPAALVLVLGTYVCVFIARVMGTLCTVYGQRIKLAAACFEGTWESYAKRL